MALPRRPLTHFAVIAALGVRIAEKVSRAA
jgi:hypothetical protein